MVWFHEVLTLDKHIILPSIATFSTKCYNYSNSKITNSSVTYNPPLALYTHTRIIGVAGVKVTSGIRLRTTILIHVTLSSLYLLYGLIHATLYKKHYSDLNFQCGLISNTFNTHLLTYNVSCYY